MRHLHEDKRFLLPTQGQHAGTGTRPGLPLQLERQILPLRIQQTYGKGDMEWQFLCLSGCRRARLLYRQGVGALGRRVAATDAQHRGAGLVVPATELGEIHGVGRFHGPHEVFCCHRLAVMPLEIKIGAAAETRRPQQVVQHAHHLRTLVVHRHGVKIVDLHVRLRTHRVRHGSGILTELMSTQYIDILDALDATGTHVGAEFLIAEYRKAFLQAQLEPVAAGDAIARPVVKIFVADNAFDALVVRIRGGLRFGQHVLGVEYIQPLVLHGTHIKVIHRHHHINIEIVFAAVLHLVPVHGLLERRHGVPAFVRVVPLHKHVQRHRAPRAGDKLIFDARQIAGHQGEQIRGLGVGILPNSIVTLPVHLALRDTIAVGQQHRTRRPVRHDGGGITRHDIRPVEEISHLAKTLGLALGAIVTAGFVQPHEGSIVLGAQLSDDLKRKGRRHPGNNQRIRVELIVTGIEGAPIEHNGHQPHIVTLQHQRALALGRVVLTHHSQTRVQAGRFLAQVKLQFNGIDAVIRRRVIFKIDGRRFLWRKLCVGHEGFLNR